MARTFAKTKRAFAPERSPISASASDFAEAVNRSICDDDADSVRSNTAGNGPMRDVFNVASTRASSVEASSASDWTALGSERET
jgi:hypothetical protein